jgi:arsenate reductase (glutaredoxin)
LIDLYGIPNCDTVKRARQWLAARGAEVQFHDFKKLGVPPTQLDAWLAACGWQTLLNRKGSTWRALDAATQAAATDAAGARALMLSHSSVIKRPVVRWPDGSISLGFDETGWATRLAARA